MDKSCAEIGMRGDLRECAIVLTNELSKKASYWSNYEHLIQLVLGRFGKIPVKVPVATSPRNQVTLPIVLRFLVGKG